MTSHQPKHAIDFHTHAFPEKVAARAVEALGTAYGVSPGAEPTVSGLLATMDAAGVDVSVVAPVATRADQVRSINEWAAETNSDRLVCFGTLHPDLRDLADEVERAVSAGLKGVKCQPNFQGFSPDDRRMWPAYEAGQGRLIFLFHSGEEISKFERIYAQPEALAKTHGMFPGLTMVVAHMGGYLMWDAVREHLLGRDIYFDTSFCPPRDLDDRRLVDLIRAHGVNRVVFATDFPWGMPGPDLDRLRRLPLTAEEMDAVAWENARDLLRLSLK
jgi:hypothetical protein